MPLSPGAFARGATALTAALALAAGLLASPATAHAQSAKLLVPLETLEATVRRDSMDALAHYDVALGYWMAKRWDDADRSLRRAIAIEPKTAAAYLALAYLPYARRPKLWDEVEKEKVPPELEGAVEEAARLYRRAFLVDPMVDLKIKGLILEPAWAVANTRRERELYAWYTRGFIYFWDGRYQAAWNWFDEVVRSVKAKEQKDLPESIFWYRGLAAAHLGRHREAEADFERLLERALEREKTDSLVRFARLHSNEVRYVLATLQAAGGRDSAAIASFETALTNDIGLYMAHAQLATLWEGRRAWPKAVLERRRALETQPEDPSLLYDLGLTLAKAREYDAATAALEEAMQANPDNARVPYTLGRVRQTVGDGAGARRAYERFLAIAPGRFSDLVTEVRRQLAELP